MNRREFCRKTVLAGGAVILSPLLKACAPADPTPTAVSQLPTTLPPTATNTPNPTATNTPQPTTKPTIEPKKSPDPTQTPTREATTSDIRHPTSEFPVALVKTTDRAYGLSAALELLALNPVRGNRVLLKPNYNSSDPTPASTHPDILRTLIEELNGMGARAITLGERSGMGDTRQVLQQTGVIALADEYGFDTVIFDELEENDWVTRQSADHHWQTGFPVPRILLDSDCVVQTCNLKTHRYGGHFTMSLKNSVGLVGKTLYPGGYNYMTELHNSPYQRQMIAEVNTVYTPSLIVMDGVDAFVDGGPAQGTLVSPSVVIAGTDPVAIDAVGVAILRLFGTTPEVQNGPVFEQEQIARAVELGLGVDNPARIQFLTPDAQSAAYAAQIRQYLLA
ncbi:MAG: DUF362 domain-containing protein [Candidatus Promineifilaceae bacterium]|jgi:uncharacterized protein (DUF362 family)